MRASVVLAIALVGAVAVLAAPSWKIQTFNYATIAFDIAFVDAKNGISPVAINGQGAWVQSTTDGGNTWNQQPSPAAGFFMGGDVAGNTAVVASILGLAYSTTPGGGVYNFTDSAEAPPAFGFVGQNVEVLNPQFYGAAGQTINNENGVAITTNGGKLFSFSNISNIRTEARYATFPSATTWYVAAGEWPNTDKQPLGGPVRDITSRIRLTSDEKKVNFKFGKTEATPNDLGWKAQIMKTTDAGKTWSSVFYDETFYFNQIGCGSETHCCATGEADTSSAPGVRVYCTTDGGNTWTRTFYNADPELSIMPLNFIGDQEVWAGGGRLNQINFQGFFLHSLDGGASWTNTTVKGIYVNCMSFPTSANGFATAFNVVDNSALLVYN